MRSRLIPIAVLLMLLAAACGGDEADIGASPTLTPTDVETGAPSPQPIPPELPSDCEDLRGEDQIELKMVDNAFEPDCLIVSAEEVGGGPAVKLENNGNRTHNWSVVDTSIDIDVAADEESNLGFDRRGGVPEGCCARTFTFFCKYHGTPDGSGMAGEIAVEVEVAFEPSSAGS
jgi:plastocyanin